MTNHRGRLTKWPSNGPLLGLYVVPRNLRLRGEDAGTWRILLEVPARLRPSGWPPTTSLPRAKPYCRGPHDRAVIARIQTEAADLLAQMKAERDGNAPAAAPGRGTIPWLIVEWGGPRLLQAVRGEIGTIEAATDPGTEGREDWLGLEASSRAPYIRALRQILGWSEENGHRHVRTIGVEQITKFLNLWRNKRVQRRRLRDLLSKLFFIAKLFNEIKANPIDDVEMPKRKRQKGGRRTRVARWSRATVQQYAKVACTEAGWRNGRGGRQALTWPGGSRLVQLMYETAADSYDVITWQRGEGGHFVDDLILPGINYDRGKTGEPTFVPISLELAAEIRSSGSIYLVVDPQGRPYTPVADDARLRGHMGTLRDYAVAAGAPRLVFDHLRHSAATEAVEAGIDIEDVKHLTAHKDSNMNRNVYVQERSETTERIQRARGLIT